MTDAFGHYDTTALAYAEARRIAEDAAVRELERAMAWAEHVAAALALVEDGAP